VVDREEGSAVVARIHHAMADGISLARVLLSLADGGEADPLGEPRPLRARLGSWLREGAGRGERLLEVGREAITHPEHLLEATGEGLVEAARLGGGSAAVARRLLTLPDEPDTRLRGPLGPRKAVAWHEGVALDEVKATARALGGTINDVLLAALAGGLCRTLRRHGESVEQLRTFVPVNLRPLDRPVPRELGNRFGLVFLDLPTAHVPARTRFLEVKHRMDAIKQSPEPAVTHAILSAVGLSSVQVERLVVEVFGRKASLITTNVPGPRTPLTLAGLPLERVLFWVPQAGGVGLGVSLFSYAGRVVWGVSSDVGRLPDPEGLVEDIAESLEALHATAREA